MQVATIMPAMSNSEAQRVPCGGQLVTNIAEWVTGVHVKVDVECVP